MSLAIAAEPTRIRLDADGTTRVGNTRILQASVLFLHNQEATLEKIQERVPSLPLADVYAAITYYLHHRVEVDACLAKQEAEAERIQREVDARHDTKRLRKKLSAHRKQNLLMPHRLLQFFQGASPSHLAVEPSGPCKRRRTRAGRAALASSIRPTWLRSTHARRLIARDLQEPPRSLPSRAYDS